MLIVIGKVSFGQTTLVLDDFGAAAQNPISRTGWTANQAGGTVWELRTTGASSAYSWANPTVNASGGANVFTNLGTNNNTKQLTYDNAISTVNYTGIFVRFGGLKSGTVPNINVLYSTDGVSYVSAGTVALTASWAAYTVGLPVASEGVANLRIRFEVVANSSTTNFFRLDDFHIIGTLTSCAAPTTTLSSNSATICAGGITSFSVGTNASPTPTYTWQGSATSGGVYATVANGTPAGTTYTGASTSSLSITGGATYFYKCLVSEASSTCVATSATASLTVNTSPTITSSPSSATICSGANVTFAAVSSGGPLTYQWYENRGAGYVAISTASTNPTYSGFNSSSLTLTNVPTSFSTYSYQCVATVASCSSATTTAAILTVLAPITSTVSVASQTVCTNTAASFSISTSASVPAYVWQASSNGTSGWANVANGTPAGVTYTGGTTFSVSMTGTSAVASYFYRCIVTDGGLCGTNSSTVSLKVNAPVAFTSGASSPSVCVGTTASFVTVGGGAAPKKWQVSTDNGVTFIDVADAAPYGSGSYTLATLSLTNAPIGFNNYQYQCVASVVGCPVVTSTIGILKVADSPTTTISPVSQTVCSANGATFTASSSAISPTYTWYQGPLGGAVSTIVSSSTPVGYTYSGNTTATMSIAFGAIGTLSRSIRVVVSDGGVCSAPSSTVDIVINTQPTITTQPTSTVVCAGVSTSFSIVSGGSPITYQWQENNGGGFADITAAPYTTYTTNVLNITATPASLNGYTYRCIVTSPACGTFTSSVGTLTVNAIPATPQTPVALANPACNSTSLAAMSSTVSGVVWYWEGSSSSGTSTVNPTSANSPAIVTSGTYYVRAYAGSCPSPGSSSVAVTILTNPVVTTQPASYTVASIGTAYFTSNVSGGNLSYQWYENSGAGFSAITDGGVLPTYAGATSSVLSIDQPPLTMNGYTYQCIATNICNTTTTDGAAKMFVGTGTNTCVVGGVLGTGYTFGCGNGASACNENSIYSAYGTFCGTTAVACGGGCNPVARNTSITLQGGCTASITAEYKNRTNVSATACANAAMDAGDQVYITNTGGTILSQSANLTGCAAFSSTTTATIPNGCGNGDGIVTMNITGGQVTIGGVMDRGDEIITYTVTYSGACANNCPVVLPISLVDFYGVQNGDKNEVIWKVAAEENIMSYLVERSSDGVEFSAVNHVLPSAPSSDIKKYSVEDLNPFNGITYYRLSTLETDWSIKYYPIISLNRNSKDIKPIFIQTENNVTVEFKNIAPKNSTVSIIDITGKEIVSKQLTESSISFNKEQFANCLYFVKIATPYKTENFKIVIQK